MTRNETIFAPDPRPLALSVLLLPQASLSALAAVLDPLRSANRHLGHPAYRWRVLSPDGGPVALSCGLTVPSDRGPEAVEADALIVVAGFRQAEVAQRPLLAALRRMAPRLRAMGGVDAGAWVLARAGLLTGHRATVHWEDLEDFATAHPDVDVQADRFVISGARFTAGGAAAAVDLMLHLIGARHGAAIAAQVAASFLHDPRPAATPQIVPHARPATDPRVMTAIARMEARLDAPEPIAATAAALGLSSRRLEMLFRRDLGMGPGAWGLRLRLQAARRLVVDTRHPIQQIALRCGFSSQSALSRAFRRQFSQSPMSLRRGTG